MLAVVRIQRLRVYAQQMRQLDNTLVTARRALVNVRSPRCDGFRVRTATLEAALSALSLWQYGIYLINHVMAVNLLIVSVSIISHSGIDLKWRTANTEGCSVLNPARLAVDV
jgi:hypothetical protein